MKPINAAFAGRIEAMRLARGHIRDQLRAEGVRLKDISASEINARAWQEFAEHRSELIDAALRNVLASTLQHLARNRRVRAASGENVQ